MINTQAKVIKYIPPKCVNCGRDKLLVRIARSKGGSIIGREKIICQDCLIKIREKLGKKDHEEIEKFFFKPYQKCPRHNRRKDMFTKDENGKWKEYCFSCEKEKWEKNLKRLKVIPLSIAKYFYEKWKISDPVIMQRLIYFAYLELLEREDILLFEEKFQAWPGGPVLESVIHPMYKHCENLTNFFAKEEEIKEEKPTVIQYLDSIAEKYLRLENLQVYKEARNKLWEKARQGLIDDKESRPIETENVFAFIKKVDEEPSVYLS